MGGAYGTVIYHNNHDGTFTTAASLGSNGLVSSVGWGDYSNDGYLDLLVGTSSASRLYRNNGNGTFTDSQSALPAIWSGSLTWGDFDNEGDLDLIFTAAATTIYRNNNGVANTPPAVPTALSALTGLTNSVVLTWTPPVDSQTASNGLNYNFRVGTMPGGGDVVSPLAHPISGRRLVVSLGNIGPTNRAVLSNLARGTYFWSVQAIDTSFAGSPFAGEGTFTITNALPTISPIADQIVAPLTPTPAITFTGADAETLARNLVITARSSDTNVVPLANLLLSVPTTAFPSNRTVQITPRTNGVSFITLTVADEQGAFASASFKVTAEPLTLLSTNLLRVQHSLVVWGDFNNDDRLDVLISGHTNGNDTAVPAAQLYRNDGNGVFIPVATSLPGLAYGNAAWGDFNYDGFLDLALTSSTRGSAGSGLTRIYRNNRDGTFTDIGAALPDALFSTVAWGDYDNDGRLDLVLSGLGTNSPITRIYRNRGDGTFTQAVSLTGQYQGSVAWADLDGDGSLHLVGAGRSIIVGGAPMTLIYRNNGDGTFTQAASLAGVYSGVATVGDYDNDGRPDLLLTGNTGSISVLTRVYHNDGGFSFTEIGAGLAGVGQASAAWGDFDNDGRLDLLLSGTSNGTRSGAFTRIYRNTGLSGALTFSSYPTALPTNYAATVTWADFGNNGTPDILVSGTDGVGYSGFARSQTILFRSNCGTSNTAPTAPNGLTFNRSNTVISLAWTQPTDAQTTNAYRLRY